MKKIFTLMAAVVMALAVNAQTFKGTISITVNNGKPTVQDATILVEKDEGAENLYNITLKDFNFSGNVKLGDIKIDGVSGENGEDDTVILAKEGQTHIDVMGGVDVTLNDGCKIEGDQLFMNMSISALNGLMKVGVEFEGTSTSTGIDKVITTTDNGVEAIYDLNGRKLNEMQKGINIVRKADGTTVKVLKK